MIASAQRTPLLSRERAEAVARSFTVFESRVEEVQVIEGAFDHVLTDPPYLPRTQDNARRGQKTRATIDAPIALGFTPLSAEKRLRWAEWMATAARRWVGVFSDHEGSVAWAADLERVGLNYVRTAIWLRRGGAPQFTGDRPAVGHECIVLAHKGRGLRWNGGGKFGVYEERVVRGDNRAHPAQKPLSLMLDLVRDFTDDGEILVDPFCGSGTTLVAAKLTGRHCAGIELDDKFASYAARRAAATPLRNTAAGDP